MNAHALNDLAEARVSLGNGTLVDRLYVLHEKLGQGGMGAVYRATHRVRGHTVALKLVTGDNVPDASHVVTAAVTHQRLSLAREFQTLASLHHPHVVRVHGYGFDPALGPYFAMDLLETTETIITAGRARPMADKVKLLAELLRAIGYLHRRGVIHRDLKPSNVLVSRGHVKTVDFGIAITGTKAEPVAGTLEYMAPELLLGSPPNELSDLYAVGVIAYELLAGGFPYSLKSTTRLLAGVLGTESDLTLPGGVAELVEARRARARGADEMKDDAGGVVWPADAGGVPPRVRAVIERLLARNEKERYRSPEEVLSDLGEAIGAPLPIETAETRESFLTAAHFVGRRTELAELTSALAEASGGRGSGFLIGGESGVGKSRIIAELRTTAMVQGCWVGEGQSLASGGAPYEEWLDLLRAMVVRAPEVSDAEAAVLGEVLPEISSLLGRPVPKAEPTTADRAEARLWDAVESLFRAMDQPGLIVLEDLHWVREESLSLLRRLVKLSGSLSVLVVCSYRSEEAPALRESLSEMRSLLLSRLPPDAVGALSSSILGPTGGRDELVRYLYQQTEGNTFFVVEVVRALAEQAGSLAAIDQGTLPEHVLTLGLTKLIERRVDRMPAFTRPLLDFCAVIGRLIDEKVIAHAFPEADLDAFLHAGAKAAVLESVEAGWRFSHDKLREVIQARLSEEERKRLHARAAEALLSIYPGAEAEARHEAVAIHWDRAEQYGKARDSYLAAGAYAMRLRLYPEARRLYLSTLSAIDRLPPTAENRALRLDALLKCVKTSLTADTADENLRRLDEAESLAGTLSASDESAMEHRRAWVSYLRGRVHYFAGRPAQAIQCYREVLPIAQKHGDAELLALPSCMLGVVLVTQGQALRSEPLLKQSLEPLLLLGEIHELARAETFHGFSLLVSGRVDEGFQELDLANERAARHPSALSIARVVRGTGYFFAWDHASAERDFTDVFRLAEQTGQPLHRYLAAFLLGWTFAYLGRAEEARARMAEADVVTTAMGGRLMIADWFAVAKAELALLCGEQERALVEAERAATTFGAQGMLLSTAVAERVWGLALGMKDSSAAGLAAAEPHIQESVKLLGQGSYLSEVARTELSWACLLRSRGEGARAAGIYERVRDTLRKHGYRAALSEAERRWAAAR